MEPEEKHQTVAFNMIDCSKIEGLPSKPAMTFYLGMNTPLVCRISCEISFSLVHPISRARGPPCAVRLLWFQLLQDGWSMAFAPIHLIRETWRYAFRWTRSIAWRLCSPQFSKALLGQTMWAPPVISCSFSPFTIVIGIIKNSYWGHKPTYRWSPLY